MAIAQQRRRYNGLWRAITILSLGFSSVLIFGGVKLSFTDLVPVQIVIEGDLRQLSVAQLSARLAKIPRQNDFLIDLEPMRSALRAEPWLQSVEIRRDWPRTRTVRIEVREYKAIARHRQGGLLDVRGHTFQPPSASYPSQLPEIDAPVARHQDAAQFIPRLARTLAKVQLHIDSVQIDARGEWELVLDDGIKLVLGREAIEQRVARFVFALPRLAKPTRIDVVDLRYTSGIAVQWKNAAGGTKG